MRATLESTNKLFNNITDMHKHVLAVLIVAFIMALIFYIGLTAFAPKQLSAPSVENSFKGPKGQPYVNGPTTPPPER